jgi:hypothetical protein
MKKLLRMVLIFFKDLTKFIIKKAGIMPAFLYHEINSDIEIVLDIKKI